MGKLSLDLHDLVVEGLVVDQQPSRGGRFPTTQWTAVELAGLDTGEHRPLLGQLLQRYWPALKDHLVRRRGLRPDRAEDMLQSFVAEKILERGILTFADRHRGSKFRSFLLTALDNYVRMQISHAAARKRSSGSPVVDVHERAEEIAGKDAAEFDSAWAREVIVEALSRMQKQCITAGHPDWWEVFEGRVLRELLQQQEPVAYEELVHRFGYKSPAQAGNVLITGKRMLERIVRDVVGEYAAGAEEVELEIDELMAALGSPARRMDLPPQ